MKVQVITLGCSKNRVDSEHLLKQLFACGIKISPEGEDLNRAKADVIVLNTCGFIKDAKQESIDAIFTAIDAKNRGLIKKVFVFGCLSQRYAQELKESIPEVDGFYGSFEMESVLKALGKNWNNELNERRYLTTPSHYAYLKISEGCDRICSFCSIPLIRGPHKSISAEKLITEAESLVSEGVKELILVAQDTTYYGVDLYKRREITSLMSKIADINGLEWLRLHYSYPAGFPEDLLELMASHPKICKYLDIPLQHISDSVLGAMRRNIDGNETRRIVEKFRDKVPGIALRTTMIVGHPGEDKKAFDELLGFIKEIRFERLGAFTYSQEEGTFGASNLKDSISEKIKQERYEKLMEVQSGISLEYNLQRVGTVDRVLIDSFDNGVYTARSQKESPEVDGEILIGHFKGENELQPNNIIGTFAQVKIENADEYDLMARFI